MPGGDRTGPAGLGPMTGRAAGYCAGYQVPGFANPVGGRGYGGWGRGGGFGRGRGFGRGFGWGAAAYGYPPQTAASNLYPYPQPAQAQMSPEQELNALKQNAQYLQDSLAEVKKRMEQLEKANKK